MIRDEIKKEYPVYKIFDRNYLLYLKYSQYYYRSLLTEVDMTRRGSKKLESLRKKASKYYQKHIDYLENSDEGVY